MMMAIKEDASDAGKNYVMPQEVLGYIFTDENGQKTFPTQGAQAELGKHSKAERFYLGSCY